MSAHGPEPIAEGVWVIRGGLRGGMSVFLVRDGGGVLAFDAGVASMTAQIDAAARTLGGLTRVVLGHGHADHRGAAAGLGAPVVCHPAAVAEAEGPPIPPYFRLRRLAPPVALFYRAVLPRWGKKAPRITATVTAGEEVGDGFTAVLLDGHAPGQIALWRERDGLALTTDVFYTVEAQTGRNCAPRLPHPAFNQDEERARDAIRHLADMDPAQAWPGHAEPVTRNVRAQLRAAAIA